MAKKKILLLCLLAMLLLGGLIGYFRLHDSNAIHRRGDNVVMVCTDGCFVYHITTQLIAPSGNPLNETEIFAFDKVNTQPSEMDRSWPNFARTDFDGRVEVSVLTGLTWGGVYRPGIDSPPQPPVPDNPRVLYFWHKDSERLWHQTEIVIEDRNIKKAQRGGLHIHIEKIQVNEKDNSQ